MKDRSVTIRLTGDLYQKLTDEAIRRSVKEKRVIKVSEVIRELIEKINDKDYE